VAQHASESIFPSTLSLNPQNFIASSKFTILEPPYSTRELRLAVDGILKSNRCHVSITHLLKKSISFFKAARLAAQLRVEAQTIEDLCKGALFQGYYRLSSCFEYVYFNSNSLELLKVWFCLVIR
jgi:hypothetical protein